MINILSAILFSFFANVDNIALGIAYGTKKIHISFLKNLLISLFTSLITIISMKLSEFIFCFLNEKFANILGSVTLALLGIFGIIKYIYCKCINKNCIKNEDITFKKLELKELMIIIFTLSCNNIATGLAASLAGINIIATFIFNFIFSFIFIYIGNKLGKNMLNEMISRYSEIIGSLLLIVISIIEYIF